MTKMNDNFFMGVQGVHAARHNTNANYENLVSYTVEKRVANNLLCDACWSSRWTKKDLLLR